MPVLDVRNPKVIDFLSEIYEKEGRIRMKWVKNHASNFEKASTFIHEEKNYKREDILKAAIEAGMAATTRDNVTSARYRTTAPIPDYKLVTVKADAKRTELLSMKPVTSDVESALLQESSKEYLKKRSLLKPEEKYKFIECSNWRYGWKLNESAIKMRGPEHGKISHVMRNLRSRVGPQRDPDHYQSPATGQKIFDAL